MAQQDWFVVREGGKEEGPYSAQQLKQMAATGCLKKNDLVRRGDAQTTKRAGDIKGLFAEFETTKVAPTAVAAPEASRSIASRFPKKTLIIASVVGGVCLFLCCGGFGLIAIIGHRMSVQLNKELDDADALWDAGKQDEAIAVYREKRQSPFLDSNNKRSPAVYGRLIDYEYEKGNADVGKSLIDEADNKKIAPTVNHADAKAALAALQAEKSRIAAEQKRKHEAGARGEVLTADFYPFKRGTVQQTMGTLSLGKLQTQWRKEYTHEGDGVITIRMLEHFTVPATGDTLPLAKPTKNLHREKDGFVEIGHEIEGLKEIVWQPYVKVGAVVGDEWARETSLGVVTERYKVVKFDKKEVPLEPGGSHKTYPVAFLEVTNTTKLDGGKSMVNIEEIQLAKGVGPVHRTTWRIENGERKKNWSEFITPVVKK